MFVLGNLLFAVAQILNIVLKIYFWIVIIRALLSWVNPDPYNPIVRFLHRVTDPVLERLRRMVPTQFGGIDFGPFIVLLVIIFLQNFLVSSLFGLAQNLR